jgi:hypothetical protein
MSLSSLLEVEIIVTVAVIVTGQDNHDDGRKSRVSNLYLVKKRSVAVVAISGGEVHICRLDLYSMTEQPFAGGGQIRTPDTGSWSVVLCREMITALYPKGRLSFLLVFQGGKNREEVEEERRKQNDKI